MDVAPGTLEKERRMTIGSVIILTGTLITMTMIWSKPTVYDYHTDLKNIAYQLSRIADALNRKGKEE